MRTLGAKSSSLLTALLVALWAFAAQAHETRPSIADVTINAEEVVMEIQINAEAFVAGVDLSTVTDTNLSEQAQTYDDLRALSAEDMEQAFRDYWPQMQDGFTIQSGAEMIPPELVSISVTETPNIELLRDAILSIRAVLPAGEDPVTIAWDTQFGPLVMRQMGGGEDAYTAFLRNGDASDPLPRIGVATEGGLAVFIRYIGIGFEHILPLGLDHILFVLGLYFLSPRIKPLVLQVTTFTLAHTVTLALGILGLVNIAPEIVEPLIAASIVYVAVENLVSREMTKWRLAIVFAFGLLHGLGFASVLGDFGLESGRFITSLIGFNVGVEFGQLTVIALAFLAVGLWFGGKSWYRPYISNPASILIGLVGAYWFVERVFL
ncbi:MAG: HupE/UreJ family protein [Pseudomonadota bacterium]